MKRSRLPAPVLVTLLLAACAPHPAADRPGPTPSCFEGIARALASDAMEGRGVGTTGLDRAAELIEQRLEAAGLEPPPGGFRQWFPAVTGVALGQENRLSLWGSPAEIASDFTPLAFSSSGEFSGPLVFAGYGIRASELGYDDYAGLDVADKVVLAMRFEPGERDENSPFDGRLPSRWSDLRYKATLAREAGARALILVSPPGEEDRLPLLRQRGPRSRAGLPVLQLSRALVERMLERSGYDLSAIHDAIDRDYRPRSVDLPSIQVSGRIDLEVTQARAANVIGIFPGAGDLARETVVVGAHYDHLGLGGEGSRVPDIEAVHNGADDNASGVAAMICGAAGAIERLSASPASRRALVVIGFAAEEIGLGGSSAYVREPVLPLDGTVAMLNLDMVGRLRDGKLFALGSDSAPEWESILHGPADRLDLDLVAGGDGYGPSDQAVFYQKGIPVVHLFTGAHADYHTPDDDGERLNIEGGARVAVFLQGVLEDLLSSDTRPTYHASSGGVLRVGDSRGYGAYLGTIPDFTQMATGADDGVLLLGVSGGGPAEEAGLSGGDRIVSMAGIGIRNLHDMTFVLRDHRAGERVEIEVVRDAARLRFWATLRARSGSGRGGRPPQSPAPEPPPGSGGDSSGDWTPTAGREADHLLLKEELHLADLRQLTSGGENAEAYFSPDGRHLIFQRTPPEGGCDQQYLMDLDTGDVTLLSSGRGRTTCGYFAYPDGERLIYATTESVSPDCPPTPDLSQGYVWPLYDYDLVWQDGPGASPEPFLPDPAYDAEATVCMRDGRVVFTSTRGGDLDLWQVNADGSDLRRLTDTPGYDGGAFFTPDCSAIVWRASRPRGEDLERYRDLLRRGRVEPSALEIFWMNVDGSGVRQLTSNGAANFGPYPLPDASGVIFSSNLGASPREFDLYVVSALGGAVERITRAPGFDGFPMFSPDGKYFVFASNRGGTGGETNIFLARWVP